jgi:acyl-coenzyme A synthetase/AMP-(fatty) acid ligase
LPLDLAAIFFTSGSTGDPKGVMWSQRGMAAAIAATVRRRNETAADRFISIAGLHYTGSCNIFSAVLSGARVYLCGDRETLFADRLAGLLEREATTIWLSSATALRLLVEGGNLAVRDLHAIRFVQISGERMPIASLRAAMEAMPNAEFHNLYAASEAFDMVEYPVPRPLRAEVSELPLGWPCPTYEVSLRDEAGREVATGETGEICVVGPAVTVGYWGDPALSAAKRLPDVPDSYRTGDLARQGADGLITLVGRQDHVVKLRGHRFDLGEIEAAAKEEPRVREAVAFVTGGSPKATDILLAVLADATGEARMDLERALQRISRERLPRFARPGRFVILGEFPLLSSGKIDRKGLEQILESV